MPLFALLLALAAAPALVNGKPITEPEVTKAVKEHIQKTLFHRQLDDKQLAEVRKKVLDKLITSELRAQEARRRGLTIPLVDVLKVAAAEEQNAGGREKFEAVLAAYGIDRQRYLEVLSRSAYAEQLAEVESDAVPLLTEADGLAQFQANSARYVVPGALTLRATCVRVDPSSNTAQWKAGEE